jgi:hypothetical protein
MKLKWEDRLGNIARPPAQKIKKKKKLQKTTYPGAVNNPAVNITCVKNWGQSLAPKRERKNTNLKNSNISY